MATLDRYTGSPGQPLKLRALRGGTVTEITAFLADMEGAYNALYSFNLTVAHWYHGRRRWRRFIDPDDFFSLLSIEAGIAPYPNYAEYVLPEYRLDLARVSIQSPGFWEFVGSLNPLQQLREYLKDRHERRKDFEYREPAEKEKLRLENELLQRVILEKETSTLRDELAIMREVGFDDSEIKQFIWSRLGPPLSRLGRHQDTKLIEGPAGADDDDHSFADSALR